MSLQLPAVANYSVLASILSDIGASQFLPSFIEAEHDDSCIHSFRVAKFVERLHGLPLDLAAKFVEKCRADSGRREGEGPSYFEFLICRLVRPRHDCEWPKGAHECISSNCWFIHQAENFSRERASLILQGQLPPRPSRTMFLHWRGEVSHASVLLRVRCGQVPQRPARDFVESARECNVTTLSGFPRCLASRLFPRRACCNKPPLGALHHRPRASPPPPANAGAEAPCNCCMMLLGTTLLSCASSVRLVFAAPFKCNAQCRRRLLA